MPARQTSSPREESFDHTLFAELLRRYVRDGKVNFRSLKENRLILDRYLAHVSSLSPEFFESFGREDKIAFLLNVCNALTLREIVAQYPLKRGSKVSPAKEEPLFLLGVPRTHEAIEHDLLRRTFRDERLHAALFRAVRTSPPIRSEPYTGQKLDQFLDEDVRRFVNDSNLNRIEPGKKKVYLCPLFQRFADDFILNYGDRRNFRRFNVQETAVLSFIADYLDPEKRRYLESGRFKIKYLPYDETLSEG